MRGFTRRLTRAMLLVALGIPVSAEPATLRVSNTGLDSVACGLASPCRSITRAVAIAGAGDTILVGPGFYADDLDDDGVFNEPGEEASSGVSITKRLACISTMGASSTFVRHSGAQQAFAIRASDVEVGRRNRGFTIRTSHHGVTLTGSSGTPIVDSRVVGNIIVFEPPVPAPVTPIGIESVSSHGRVEHNRIIGTGHPCAGYVSFDSADAIAHNTVAGCGTGFIDLASVGTSYVRNTLLGNGEGFILDGTIAAFSENVVIGNGIGVRLENPTTTVTLLGNTFAGNRGNCGVQNNTGTTIQATGNYWGAPTGPGLEHRSV